MRNYDSVIKVIGRNITDPFAIGILEVKYKLPFVLEAASAIFWKVSKNEPKTTIVVLIKR